jgi:hypothetical protein
VAAVATMGLFDHLTNDASLKLHRRGSHSHTPIDMANASTHEYDYNGWRGSTEEKEMEMLQRGSKLCHETKPAHSPQSGFGRRRSSAIIALMALAFVAAAAIGGYSVINTTDATTGFAADDGMPLLCLPLRDVIVHQ